MEEILIPIVAVGGFFTMIILLRQFTNKERMLMIEKGADPSQFKIAQNNSWPLILGALAIGAGIGLVIANFFESNLGMDEVVYPAMVFIFGGIGLIVGRKMVQKEEK
jgi:hypothetical protein